MPLLAERLGLLNWGAPRDEYHGAPIPKTNRFLRESTAVHSKYRILIVLPWQDFEDHRDGLAAVPARHNYFFFKPAALASSSALSVFSHEKAVNLLPSAPLIS